MIQSNLSAAIREAIRRAGSQLALARNCGVSQGMISDYLYGRHKIENMTIGTFDKLFPDAKIDFFGEQAKDDTVGELKTELNRIFDVLSPADRVHLLTIVAANFGRKIALIKKT